MNILLNTKAAKPPYAAAKRALELGAEKVIAELKASGLSGRGGAGFPAGVKWEISPAANGVTLTTNHPGGGKSRLELTKEEAKKLAEEIMEKSGP